MAETQINSAVQWYSVNRVISSLRIHTAVIVSLGEDVELHENNTCAPLLQEEENMQIYENLTLTSVSYLDHPLFRTSGKPEPAMVTITSKKGTAVPVLN